MMLPKLKRKAKKIWEKSVRRLDFGGLKKIAVVVLLVGLNIYGFSAIIGWTSGYFSDTETGQVVVSVGIWGTPTPSPTPSPSGVVLNEFLPRPENNGPKPNGEWVELYNLSATDTIDLAGYYLMDNYSGSGPATHKIFVESCRTNTGGTTILPHGFLVVYANEGGGEGCNSHGFELNNNGDSVRFFNPSSQLLDSYSYTDSEFCSLTPTPGNSNNDDSEGSCSKIEKNKSFARIPDGIGPWYDPIPTPGGPNVLEEEQEPIVDLQNENQSASPSFSETLGAVAGAITEFVLGEEEVVVSASGFGELTAGTETVVDVPDLAPVASESVEPLVEPPLDSPAGDPEGEQAPNGASLTGQALPESSVTPEPAVTPEPTDNPQPVTGDESLIQTVTEPAIPVEPVTPSAGSGQAVEPPADPLIPAPELAPAPAEAPAPAPAE